MSNTRRILVVVTLVVIAVVAVGYASGIGRGSDQRSYHDAQQLMDRAGVNIDQAQPTLAASWPARIRKRCTGMLSGFTRDGSGTSVQTWVCKSSSDADAFKASIAAGPHHVVTVSGKPGGYRYSTRQNLVFFVMGNSQASADRLTSMLQHS